MQARITKLETQFASARRNDIRLGDIVVTTDRDTNRIKLKNLVTGNEKHLGDPDDAEFSYSGTLTVEEGGSFSPPYVMPQTSAANTIVLAQIVANGSVTVDVHFNNGSYTKRVTMLDGETIHIEGVNIPVGINTQIYVELIDADEGTQDLSVIIRFGDGSTPNGGDGSTPNRTDT
jgi:hypothetical protein